MPQNCQQLACNWFPDDSGLLFLVLHQLKVFKFNLTFEPVMVDIIFDRTLMTFGPKLFLVCDDA